MFVEIDKSQLPLIKVKFGKKISGGAIFLFWNSAVNKTTTHIINNNFKFSNIVMSLRHIKIK